MSKDDRSGVGAAVESYLASKANEIFIASSSDDDAEAENSASLVEIKEKEIPKLPRRPVDNTIEHFLPLRKKDLDLTCFMIHDVFTREECEAFCERADTRIGSRRVRYHHVLHSHDLSFQ